MDVTTTGGNATGGDPPPGKDGGVEVTAAPWPMLGQGPAHRSRNLSTTTTTGPHRSWELALGENLYGSCVIARDGTIYAATAHELHAISPTGTEKWKVPIQSGYVEMPSPAVGPDGAVYVSNGGELVAFDPSGAIRWHTDIPSGLASSPTVTADGTIYVAMGGGNLVVVSPSGAIVSMFGLGIDTGGLCSTPMFGPEGTRAVMKVNTMDTEVWSFGPGGEPRFDVTHAGAVLGLEGYLVGGADGTTYFSANDGLKALDSKGAVLWIHPGAMSNEGPAIAADGTVYPCIGAPVHALHPDGTLKWTYDGGVKAFGNSVAVAADGTIYSVGDRFYRVSPEGALLSVVDVGSPISSPVAIDDDGTAFFGAWDGSLYAR